MSLLIFLLCSSPEFGEHLWLLLWIIYYVDCLSPYCLVLFLRFYLVLLIGICSSVSLFCLALCICFSVLGISALPPSPQREDLFKRCSVGLRSTIPPNYQSQALKDHPPCKLSVPDHCR